MKLRRIGYWATQGEPESVYPAPVEGVLTAESAEFLGNYFGRGFVARAYLGRSRCRICGTDVGSLELSDGVLLWPESLGHYVKAHRVGLPEFVLQHVERRIRALEDATSDDGALASDTTLAVSSPLSEFQLLIASDVSDRDGIGLEMRDATGDLVAEIFRDDEHDTVTFSTDTSVRMPLGTLEALVESARRALMITAPYIIASDARASDQDLAALEALSEVVPASPWRSWIEGRDGESGDSFIAVGEVGAHEHEIFVDYDGSPASADILDFVAVSRTLVPLLIDEVRRSRRGEAE